MFESEYSSGVSDIESGLHSGFHRGLLPGAGARSRPARRAGHPQNSDPELDPGDWGVGARGAGRLQMPDGPGYGQRPDVSARRLGRGGAGWDVGQTAGGRADAPASSGPLLCFRASFRRKSFTF